MPRKKYSIKKDRSLEELRKIVLRAGEVCLERKAEDVVVLDLKKVSDMTDFFVICEGYTDIHVRAIADNVRDKLKEEYGLSPWHVEGMENGSWVLLDYVDFVMHVFQPETRQFYQLERLWTDARRHELHDEAPAPVAEGRQA